MESTLNRTVIFKNVKTKTLATVIAVIASVALPQALHLLGAVSDMGTALGETFLPMHLAVFMVGFLAGPAAGLVTGLLAPLVSFWLTDMPTALMLPFIVIELAGYGLISGALADKKLPSIVKLLIAQIGGRALRAAAVLIAVNFFGTGLDPYAVIIKSVVMGLPGLIIQWIFIPLMLYRISGMVNRDD